MESNVPLRPLRTFLTPEQVFQEVAEEEKAFLGEAAYNQVMKEKRQIAERRRREREERRKNSQQMTASIATL